MLLHFKRRDDFSPDTTAPPPPVDVPAFLPYAAHYDPATLLTKNGELLHILRIGASEGGRDYELPGAQEIRQSLRAALKEAVDGDDLAVWVHTIRSRLRIAHEPDFPDEFTKTLHAAWRKAHPWRHRYVNEIYVSLLTRGQPTRLMRPAEWRGLLSGINRRAHERHLSAAAERLHGVTQRLLAHLAPHCGARVLGCTERGGNFVSEPLEFLHYLLNLHADTVPVAEMQADAQLATHALSFGFDALESRSAEGVRRFGAIVTLKGCPELSAQALDRCLQMPEELVVTQAFNFLPEKEALGDVRAIRSLLEGAEDPAASLHLNGLDGILAARTGNPTDFGEQQLSIMITDDHYRDADAAAGRLQDAFAQLGLVSVREEVRLEECFWAQLPGNFTFLKRKSPIPASRLGGFARLNRFPSGQGEGTRWGGSLALLPTLSGTPYAFNFHLGDAGHTALLDFNSFADERGAALLNFLLAQARQYDARIVVIDRNYTSRPLIKALGGTYKEPLADIRLNPLTLEDTPRNRAFLAAWLLPFVQEAGGRNEAALRETLKDALDELYHAPPQGRGMRALAGLLAPRGVRLNTLFPIGEGEDELNLSGAACGIEMQRAMAKRELALPVFSYLLHRLILSLDGRPTIIVLQEAWDLLNNDFFVPRLASLLAMLTQQNALAVFATRRFDEVSDTHLTAEILRDCPTRLILPDDVTADYFPATLGLSDEETKQLKRLERQRGEFLVQHGQESAACVFDINLFKSLAPTLSGDARALRLTQIQER